MRVYASEPERRLWQELRGGRLGVVFRRQVVLGRYVADFAAPSVRLVVEVDGAIHARPQRADERRDRDLGRLGYSVLRVPAALVMKDIAPPSRWCAARWTSAAADARSNCRIKLTSFAGSLSGRWAQTPGRPRRTGVMRERYEA